MNLLLTLTSFLIFLGFSLLPVQVHAAVNTYYVTQNGNGVRSGNSLGNAMSASDFNALRGTGYAGNTFFFYGTFTTRIVVKNIEGTSGHPITIDGYEAGSCDPVNDDCASGADLKQGITIGNASTGPDYITVQDFKATNTSGSQSGINVDGVSGNHSSHIIIQRNYIYHTTGSMLHVWYTDYVSILNNKAFVFGQGANPAQGVDFINSNDLVVRGNEFGHDESGYPSDCNSAEMVELHGCHRVLMEYNDVYGAPNQSGIRPKEGGNQDDIIIRFNKVHDNLGNSGHGIYLGVGSYGGSTTLSDFYIYGNFVYHNTFFGIAVDSTTNGIRIWSNIVTNNGREGGVYIFRNSYDPSYVYIYNNTIAENGGVLLTSDNDRAGITIKNGSHIEVKNNLLWNNRPTGGGSKYHQIYDLAGATYGYNTHFHSSHDLSSGAFAYYSGSADTLSELNAESTIGTDEVADPGFIDPNGADNTYGTVDDDYRISATGTSGQDLSACFDVSVQGTNYHMCYGDALDPTLTNWKTTPPTVKTTRQGDHGNWERGAYVYTGDAPQSPNLAAPSSLRIMNN